MSDYYVDAIASTFEQFNIDAEVTNSTTGPSVIRYEVTLGSGVRVEKISGLQGNLAYATKAESVRVLAPIPGKSAVGIELPRSDRQTVELTDLPVDDHPLSFPVGVDVEGEAVAANLGKMPHLLVAGTTGSGKSCFINSMLVSMLRADPKKLKLVLIDPKMVELTPYQGVPHLLYPVITETDRAVEVLKALVTEMEERYELMRDMGERNIENLDLPYIVVVIDELADLMGVGKAMAGRGEGNPVELLIVRLAQKARAAGIHLVLATQRPDVTVVTGLIKANVPSRLAFATASQTDSRVILDEKGADQLLGMGDGLFKPVGARTAVRIQSAYVSDETIELAVADAKTTGHVEDMVEELHPEVEQPPTVLEYINGMLDAADAAVQRADAYFAEFHKPKKWFSSKVEILTEAPTVLGETSDALVDLRNRLRALRDEALMQSN